MSWLRLRQKLQSTPSQNNPWASNGIHSILTTRLCDSKGKGLLFTIYPIQRAVTYYANTQNCRCINGVTLRGYISEVTAPHQPDVLEMFDELFIIVPLASHFLLQTPDIRFLGVLRRTNSVYTCIAQQVTNEQLAKSNRQHSFIICNKPTVT